jgi:hypothetical protein
MFAPLPSRLSKLAHIDEDFSAFMTARRDG